MQVLTCEKKVCWVSALSDSIIHCISELGGMPDTKAPNDQEVLFESVALGFILYIFFFLFATAARTTASQKVELSDGMYFVEEKRSIQMTLTLHISFCHYRFVIQLKRSLLVSVMFQSEIFIFFPMFLYLVATEASQTSLHSSCLLYTSCIIQKDKILLELS